MIKAILIGVWGLIIANQFLAFPATLSLSLNVLGGLLIVAHLVEFFVFRDKIRSKADHPLKAFIMTMVFGLAYIQGR